MTNLEACIILAKHYSAKSRDKEDLEKVILNPEVINGVTFYQVGHNSSHLFYLGVDEAGELWKRSYACEQILDTDIMSYEEFRKLDNSPNLEDWAKANAANKWVVDEVIRPATLQNIGYIGHW